MENERKDIKLLAKKYNKLQTLMCYVNKETLLKEHKKQIYGKASGVDRVTKEHYGINLDENIDSLIKRMKSFSYKPQPVRRTYIPKPGSDKLRPLGIPSYEDKLVQGSMAYVLNEIYETKFLNSSYGFRPKRNCHMAVREINQLIMTRKVGYILDCDIKGFFDNVNHEWLMKFLNHDIEDKNFLRYISRFLKSGVIEDLKYYETDKGTPQGGLISPVLANVYLHFALDLWFEYIKKTFSGEMYLIRYADDFVILCQYENESKKLYGLLKQRLNKFGLELAEDKSRILPFGRFKGNNKDKFDFLGFTFINGKTNTYKYGVKIITSRTKLKIKRYNVKEWLLRVMHFNTDEVFKTLNRKLVGHCNYYGINGNYESLKKYYKYVKDIFYKILNKRSQKKSIESRKYTMLWNKYISKPHIVVNIWNWQTN